MLLFCVLSAGGVIVICILFPLIVVLYELKSYSNPPSYVCIFILTIGKLLSDSSVTYFKFVFPKTSLIVKVSSKYPSVTTDNLYIKYLLSTSLYNKLNLSLYVFAVEILSISVNATPFSIDLIPFGAYKVSDG